MKPYTCTALRIPHMTKIEIVSIDFDMETYISNDDDWLFDITRPLSELRYIEISNRGRIDPDYSIHP